MQEPEFLPALCFFWVEFGSGLYTGSSGSAHFAAAVTIMFGPQLPFASFLFRLFRVQFHGALALLLDVFGLPRVGDQVCCIRRTIWCVSSQLWQALQRIWLPS